MTLPAEVIRWLDDQGYGRVVSGRSAGGGCISNGEVVRTNSGRSFFLKTNTSVPTDFFKQEAAGLEALRVPAGTRLPACYLVGVNFILLEDLRPTGRGKLYWPELGRGLATIHAKTNPRFGFDENNYIGSTPQPNNWVEDGYEFFADQRLGFQVNLAFDAQLLSPTELKQVEKLSVRLPELIPRQPASMTHGDLWSGNIIADEAGSPVIIDPAAYYGWAEADLAMMSLFGSYPDEFIRSYSEIRPLEPGFKERYPIYNLYHLLNHLNLFGGGYLHQVRHILNQFS